MLNDAGNGEFTVTIANPLTISFLGLPVEGTTLPGNETGPDCVLSVQDNGGQYQVRRQGTTGSFEKARKIPGFLRYEPRPGQVYLVPYTE